MSVPGNIVGVLVPPSPFVTGRSRATGMVKQIQLAGQSASLSQAVVLGRQ
jgi:hypothetical protein